MSLKEQEDLVKKFVLSTDLTLEDKSSLDSIINSTTLKLFNNFDYYLCALSNLIFLMYEYSDNRILKNNFYKYILMERQAFFFNFGNLKHSSIYFFIKGYLDYREVDASEELFKFWSYLSTYLTENKFKELFENMNNYFSNLKKKGFYNQLLEIVDFNQNEEVLKKVFSALFAETISKLQKDFPSEFLETKNEYDLALKKAIKQKKLK